jgi:multiple antibiotic resistance protein
MSDFLHSFVLTFVPLFIVLDALGNLPIVISMTEDMTAQGRYRVIHIAMATATVVGLIFLLFGQFILNVLSISVGSFAMAGGIILLVLSIKYMRSGHMTHVIKEEMIAVVPIGTPLVVGPATITTLLVLSQEYALYIVLLSFLVNLFISWIVFLLSNRIIRIIGVGGLRAISRVFALLLAAIAVSMVVHGLRLVGILK